MTIYLSLLMNSVLSCDFMVLVSIHSFFSFKNILFWFICSPITDAIITAIIPLLSHLLTCFLMNTYYAWTVVPKGRAMMTMKKNDPIECQRQKCKPRLTRCSDKRNKWSSGWLWSWGWINWNVCSMAWGNCGVSNGTQTREMSVPPERSIVHPPSYCHCFVT